MKKSKRFARHGEEGCFFDGGLMGFWLSVALWLFLFDFARAEPPEIPADYSCISCHTDLAGGEPLSSLDPDIQRLVAPVTDWEQSVHRANGVFCADCHGGNTQDMDLAKEESEGFIGKPTREQAIKICGDCHADAERFKGTGLKTNQRELYEKSVHYEQFVDGNAIAPICVDCHSNHNIQPVKQKKTQEVCFSCHVQSAEDFKAGAHWKAYQESAAPICKDCHGNHDPTLATLDLFTAAPPRGCAECHAPGSKEAELTARMISAREASIGSLESALAGIEGLHKNRAGFVTHDLEAQIEKYKERLKEIASLTHKVDTIAVETESAKVDEGLAKVESAIESYATRSAERKKWVALLVALIVGLMISGYALWKNIERHRTD